MSVLRSPTQEGPRGKSPIQSEDLRDEKPVHFCSTSDFQSTIRFTSFSLLVYITVKKVKGVIT